MNRMRAWAFVSVATLFIFSVNQRAAGCACGCGIFEVGTGALYPTGPGAKISLESDYMDQNQNWSGTSAAPAANNDDKEIRTGFYKLDVELMFDHSWGIAVEVPVWDRYFSTINDSGNLVDLTELGLADIRIMGMYTGLSKDMSTGIMFGVKLPTGNDNYFHDPDTEIGTGSTDLLLGVYHFGRLFGSSNWIWTADTRLDWPFLFQNGYLPGSEIDASLGVNYRGFYIGDLNIVPIFQVAGSYRLPDESAPTDVTGNADGSVNYNEGDPGNSGYTRLLVVPGLDLEWNNLRLFATVGIPVYANVTGNQLVAPYLFRVVASYSF